MTYVKKIIYAAYGSNLLRKRFLAYINGGDFYGKYYSGCSNKRKPISLGYIFVPYKLYFAKSSKSWNNGGIAFLKKFEEIDINNSALVRLWEITEDQFYEIWEQEGKSIYTYLLELGKIKNKKILTFTGDWEDEINKPSEAYIDIIKKGLKETTGWNEKQIDTYINKFI